MDVRYADFGGNRKGEKMRIIAGELKNLKLLEVGGEKIHPMGERVRGALFNILGERVRGARLFDMCAGTGAVGIEALSRGAESVVFVEKDMKVVEVLRKNVAMVGMRSGQDLVKKCEIISGDVSKLLTFNEKCDIMVVDAPYEMYREAKFFDGLMKNAENLVDSGGILVLSAPQETREGVGFLKIEARKYAGAVLNFYERV